MPPNLIRRLCCEQFATFISQTEPYTHSCCYCTEIHNHESLNFNIEFCECLSEFQAGATLSPRSSSRRDRLISATRAFMRSHSWNATITYGVRSSGITFAISSCSGNGSGNFSITSSRAVLICKTLAV